MGPEERDSIQPEREASVAKVRVEIGRLKETGGRDWEQLDNQEISSNAPS